MKKLWTLVGSAALLAVAQGAHASTFTDGSFESPGATDPFATLASGDSIGAWTVGGAGVDYIGNYWKASDGNDSLDLSALDNGGVSQTFDTVSGDTYTVKFDYSANPAGPPTVATLAVFATGGTLASFTYDKSVNNPSIGAGGDMQWLQGVYTFVATASSTTLSFLSANVPGTSFGAALDNVSVAATPIPPALLMFITALVGLGGLGYQRRRSMQA